MAVASSSINPTNSGTNWIKACLALKITKEGIEPFVFDEIKQFQQKCLADICYKNGLPSGTICSSCCTENVVECPTRRTCNVVGRQCRYHKGVSKQYFPAGCPNQICHNLKKEIQNAHRFYGPSYKNTDATQWCTNPWEVAKCFMPPDGYKDVTSSAETDFNGINSVILNYRDFQAKISDNLSKKSKIFKKGRSIDRAVRHSASLEVEEADLQQYFTDLHNLLSDPKYIAGDKDAQNALKKLSQLQNDTLDIVMKKSPQMLKDVAYDFQHHMKEEKDDLKTKSDEQNVELIKTIDETIVEPRKSSLSEISDDVTSALSKIEAKRKTVKHQMHRNLDEGVKKLNIEPGVGVKRITSSTDNPIRRLNKNITKVNEQTKEDKYNKLKKGGENSEWDNVTTIEDTKLLLTSNGQLPDAVTLNNMVQRLGIGSDTIVFVCHKICRQIEESTPYVAHVFAAYTIECSDKVHFVQFLDNASRKPDLNKDYNIVCRYQKDDTNESRQKEEILELSTKESLSLKETINAVSKEYMDKFKYLSAITARKIKSVEEENLCIVLYVHSCTDRYSSIPITEEPLPNVINGYTVVVRNGVFKLAKNNAGQSHTNLLMGCKISSNFNSPCSGTIGGFVDHPEYGLCGFTCAHVVYNYKQMQNLKREKRVKDVFSNEPCLVYQPSSETSPTPIGRVVEAVYTEGGGGKAGVDLALFQIENRPPLSGTFPTDEWIDTLRYVTGKTWGRTRLTRGAPDIIKFGFVTGLTYGKVVFDEMSVKNLTFNTKKALVEVDSTLYNQYEIVNDTSNFCELGDSGGLAFTEDCLKELVCIGMVNGILDEEHHLDGEDRPFHGVVTPIIDILHKLGDLQLKPFQKELNDHYLTANDKARELQQKQSNEELLSNIRQEFMNVYAFVEKRVSDVGKEVQSLKKQIQEKNSNDNSNAI